MIVFMIFANAAWIYVLSVAHEEQSQAQQSEVRSGTLAMVFDKIPEHTHSPKWKSLRINRNADLGTPS